MYTLKWIGAWLVAAAIWYAAAKLFSGVVMLVADLLEFPIIKYAVMALVAVWMLLMVPVVVALWPSRNKSRPGVKGPQMIGSRHD